MAGRQMTRSNSTAVGRHHRQRSDNFLGVGSGSRWLLPNSFSSSASQDFGFGSRTATARALRKNWDGHVSSGELSPGLLDLHSFDTELLTEVPISSHYEGCKLNQHSRGKSFEDSEPYLTSYHIGNRSNSLAEHNLLKSFSLEKEKANNVAKIKVVVRKRPLNKKEVAKKEEDIITIEPNSNSVTVHETKLKVDLTEYIEKHDFMFDAVLNEGVSNDEVYSETVEPIVPLIFHRTKATCFAYGQTGSGKTYTMQPLPLKASRDILRLMNNMYRNQGFQLFVSFFEIYGGKLFDLLNDRKKLCMREDGKQQVCIVGLQEYKVSDVEVIKEFIEKGNATRSTGMTGANEESSRSHAILQLAIKRSPDGSESKPVRLMGKLSFIDLAGSERGADTTDNDKQTRMEGAEINKSLLALKECIRALDSDQGHIPFRGSKLTEVLRDSFVGDSRTVMISCISPSSGSCEHTLNTLRYADRVKSLSKGSISKRDPLSSSSSSLRDTSALPLTSGVLAESNFEDNVIDIASEKNSFGWQTIMKRETSPSFNVDRVPNGREEGNSALTTCSNLDNGEQAIRNNIFQNGFGYTGKTYLQGRHSEQNNVEAGACQLCALGDMQRTDAVMKKRDITGYWDSNSQSEDDLNALLLEEDDLVSAHRKQVEETLDIVREEMNLLVEADQPGNQLDDYISKLNAILSQKAAGILQLQKRLAQFQRRLNEQSVLVSSCSN